MTHRRSPTAAVAAAALGLALGVLLARRQRRPPGPRRPVPLHLVGRDAFERGVFADLARARGPVYRPAPATLRATVPRPR